MHMHVFAYTYNKSNHVQVNFDLEIKYYIIKVNCKKNLWAKEKLLLSSQNVIFIQCSFSTILKSQLTYTYSIWFMYIHFKSIFLTWTFCCGKTLNSPVSSSNKICNAVKFTIFFSWKKGLNCSGLRHNFDRIFFNNQPPRP